MIHQSGTGHQTVGAGVDRGSEPLPDNQSGKQEHNKIFITPLEKMGKDNIKNAHVHHRFDAPPQNAEVATGGFGAQPGPGLLYDQVGQAAPISMVRIKGIIRFHNENSKNLVLTTDGHEQIQTFSGCHDKK